LIYFHFCIRFLAEKMILLDYHNKIIEDTLLEKFNNPENATGKFEAIEIVLADFDGVTFHISTPDQNAKNLVNVSMSMKCWAQLKEHGVDDVFQKHYGSFLTSVEAPYDVTLQLNLAAPPTDVAKTVRDIALMKRHALAAPFYKAFDAIESKSAGSLLEIQYRDDEAIYLKPESDRLVVVFDVAFKDADDVVFAKKFLEEYQDARKTINNAPVVTYSQKEPPMELSGAKNIRVGSNNGFVSFVLFPPHIKNRERTVDNITEFRNYLHYHIKCSKAYMHTRMRNKVRNFLQVLNRAKQEPLSTEKKTMTGKTFRRPDDPAPSADAEFNV